MPPSALKPPAGDGIINGARPYRLLNETSMKDGWRRVRVVGCLALIFFVLGCLYLIYELAWYNVRDRDARDMAWDYRVTSAASLTFHKYFRMVSWATYYYINAAADVFREVVVAGYDRPVVLFLQGGTCTRTVTVPCLLAKPSWRDTATNGQLNVATEAGTWAVGNGKCMKSAATTFAKSLVDATDANCGLGVDDTPMYASGADMAQYYVTRYDELNAMRAAITVACSNGGGTGACTISAGSQTQNLAATPPILETCGPTGYNITSTTATWTYCQWLSWADNNYGATGSGRPLATDTCTISIDVDVCVQTTAALQVAGQVSGNAGAVAIRDVAGAFSSSNVHTKAIVSSLTSTPGLAVVTSNQATLSLSSAVTPYYPATDTADVTYQISTAYVPQITITNFVTAAAAVAGGGAISGYALPPSDSATSFTQYYGFYQGVTINGVRATLNYTYETSDDWKTRAGYFDAAFWPWKTPCGDTAHNVTTFSLLNSPLTVTSWPAYNGQGAVPVIPVVVFGTTTRVPAYQSDCDFDAVAAAAGTGVLTCAAARLSHVEIRVAFTPVASATFGAWRVVDVVPTYGAATSGTEATLIAKWGTTQTMTVTLRDAGAPEALTTPALNTQWNVVWAITLFSAFAVSAPVYVLLMMTVEENVCINQGKPPPGWKWDVRFRGW